MAPTASLEDRIGILKLMSSILPCELSLFSQEKSPEISGKYEKIPLITENFGNLGSTFQGNIG